MRAKQLGETLLERGSKNGFAVLLGVTVVTVTLFPTYLYDTLRVVRPKNE